MIISLTLFLIAGMQLVLVITFLNVMSIYALLSPSSNCINYDSSERTITISCLSASLDDIYNKLHNNDILSKQQFSSGNIFLLNAGLTIQKGSTFYINSTDTDWLKIVADGVNLNEIKVLGSLKIDSVKITSWNPATNNYGVTDGSRHSVKDKLVTDKGDVRPVIKVEGGATGTTDITNSEIAYLGYEGGTSPGASGLSYYGGDNSIIKNNKIHNLYFGFYSKGVGGMTIENNYIYDNNIYGLDPHTGTHDMVIRNNFVYNNGGFGIICSVDCYNITIEKNEVHDNYHGIMLSRNMTNSFVKNNIVYNENVSGIFVSDSYNNQIVKNTISNSAAGIFINTHASNNQISENTITNSKEGITIDDDDGAENLIHNNKIILDNQDKSDKNSPGKSKLQTGKGSQIKRNN
jgi:poly(beta-D-mannuronate) C5 epimerase